MVKLDKIVTKKGDGGHTRLATGEAVAKDSLRISANGEIDEINALIGLILLHLKDDDDRSLTESLQNRQHDLFDLGADISTPLHVKNLSWEPIRLRKAHLERLEKDLEAFLEPLAPLTSFILPGGRAASAWLHLARTVTRRAERAIVRLDREESGSVSPLALKYLNRLSDYFFVMARFANNLGKEDILWESGKTKR